MLALAENAIDNGVELKLETEVKDIEKENRIYKVITSKGDFKTRLVINCAGVFADKLSFVKESALRACPRIPFNKSIRIFAGLVDEISEGLEKNLSFNLRRRKVVRFNKLSPQEQVDIIKINPAYGNIICRCETVTEAEIVDCIHRSAGARTVKGVKNRVRPGTGRCQGGFCGPIMARRLTLEGAQVLAVTEIMPYSGGLNRNIVQCLNDFEIPLYLSHTITDIRGRDRVEGVTIAEVDEDMRLIPEM